MKFDVLTIFPSIVEAVASESILAKAQAKGLIDIKVHDLRKWTDDARGTVDDKPFGGGPGMLLKIEPIYLALKELGVYPTRSDKTKVVMTSAGGQKWNQTSAYEFSEKVDHVVIICGRYEGVDYRVIEHLIDQEVSIGEYVLTGGELAAGVLIDSISRLIPGVLGNEESLTDESHSGMDQEYPQYTRPAQFETEEGEAWKVPEVLISGDHAKIAKWKNDNSK